MMLAFSVVKCLLVKVSRSLKFAATAAHDNRSLLLEVHVGRVGGNRWRGVKGIGEKATA